MEVLVECCAGIDIGKDEVVACVRTPAASGRGRQKQTRTFASFTASLEAMADWLAAEGVTEVAMEATGSYWKPVWYVLEDRAFALWLCQPELAPVFSCDLAPLWVGGRSEVLL